MIFYLSEPLELWFDYTSRQQRFYKLPSGGILTVEVLPDHRMRVVSVLSTDPMDYMNTAWTPGRIAENI